MENKPGCGFCDSIVIHNYPNAKGIHALVNFRRGGKIVFRSVMVDVNAVLAYMARQPFCQGIPYKVITHKG